MLFVKKSLILQAKYGILVLAFVGEFHATARWCLSHALEQRMKVRKLLAMKTYKFKLYSNHRHRELHKTIDGCRHVWNYCIVLQRRYYRVGASTQEGEVVSPSSDG